jgi:hypothetical protein
MREQTKRNAGYLAGLNRLSGIAKRIGWSAAQFEAARAELVRRFQPTLVEI